MLPLYPLPILPQTSWEEQICSILATSIVSPGGQWWGARERKGPAHLCPHRPLGVRLKGLCWGWASLPLPWPGRGAAQPLSPSPAGVAAFSPSPQPHPKEASRGCETTWWEEGFREAGVPNQVES